MRKLYFFLFLLLIGASAVAQQRVQVTTTLDANSVVKDSTGFQYPHAIWAKLMQTGSYGIRVAKGTDSNIEFLIYELSAAERSRRMETYPKPRETTNFKTGSKLPNFRFTDLEGNRYNLKELAGKVVVLNFWFINCGPCRIEIPDLNKMVLKFKDNPNVVFLAVALDSHADVKEFLKGTPFLYNITENGAYLTKFYGVNSYPTHVVVDQNAIIQFHTTGLALNTVYWIDKTIEVALKQSDRGKVEGD
ncbi:TlpA family protein disulfide reductase [Flavihumibacter sp. R14]|nr:TlpA family protein disulfide reductase [Flavihumibacter soli]